MFSEFVTAKGTVMLLEEVLIILNQLRFVVLQMLVAANISCQRNQETFTTTTF